MTSTGKTAVAGLAAALVMLSGPALASSFTDAIVAAEQQFGGEAFKAERYREDGRSFVEVEVLSGNQLVEVYVRADNLRIVDSDTYGSPRRVARVAAALERASLSLVEAAELAKDALGRGQLREAKVQVTQQENRNGRRFIVELRNSDDEYFDVVLNSRRGDVIRITRDD